jgi:hypothetical protein
VFGFEQQMYYISESITALILLCILPELLLLVFFQIQKNIAWMMRPQQQNSKRSPKIQMQLLG